MSATTLVPTLLDARAAAKALGIGTRTLWTLTKRGELRHVRIRGRVLYDPGDLRVYIDRNRQGGAA